MPFRPSAHVSNTWYDTMVAGKGCLYDSGHLIVLISLSDARESDYIGAEPVEPFGFTCIASGNWGTLVV